MKKIPYLHGSAEEVGIELQKNYDRMLEATKRWAEIISLDPLPETALTPKDVVWRKNKARLYRYLNHRGYKYRTPILFIYTLVNKYYINDMIPGSSMMQHLVDKGFDVYMLDWGDYDWEDRNLTFGDLIHDYIHRAVKKVCQFSEVEEISILGGSIGGTMAAIYTALFDKPKIKNLGFIVSPFDFSEGEEGIGSGTGIWLKAPSFDVDKITDTFGLIPKDVMGYGMKLLNPVNTFIGNYTRLWRYIYEGKSIYKWKALNKWLNDQTAFPGELYRQWVKDFYQGNKLIKGELVIKGQLVDLSKITCPLLVLAGEKDHLVRPEQTRDIIDISSSTDTTYHEFPVGHVGIAFSQYAQDVVYPTIAEWFAERSEPC